MDSIPCLDSCTSETDSQRTLFIMPTRVSLTRVHSPNFKLISVTVNYDGTAFWEQDSSTMCGTLGRRLVLILNQDQGATASLRTRTPVDDTLQSPSHIGTALSGVPVFIRPVK